MAFIVTKVSARNAIKEWDMSHPTRQKDGYAGFLG